MSIHVEFRDGTSALLDHGEILLHHSDTLDEVLRSMGEPTLSSYGDDRSVPEDFDGDPEDLYEHLGDFDEWFDRTHAVASLRKLVASHAHVHLGREITEALEELLRALQSSAGEFHIAVG